MNFLRIALLVFVLAPIPARAADSAEASGKGETKSKPSKGSNFVFSLLPKSLQKNPRLDFNIITEVTAEGRRVKPPTVQNPAYYVAQAAGMHNTGIGVEESLKGPAPEKLKLMLDKALADAGYRESQGDGHPASLAIMYVWGSSSFQPPASIAPDTPPGGSTAEPDPAGTGDIPVPEIVLRRALLDRALLLGGAKFAKDVGDAMEEVDRNARLESSVASVLSSDFAGGGPMTQDPFDRLRMRSPDMDRLVDELFSSSYFVVASAYDYAALAKGQRRLLWRTKMTVNSLGVNMTESVPPLIASAAPYLGRETKEPVLVTKRIGREGRVEVGTPVVVPDREKKDATPPADSAKKAGP